MYNDLLGKKPVEKTKSRTNISGEEFNDVLHCLLWSVENSTVNVKGEIFELDRLATFLQENFSEHIDNGGLIVDNAIHLLKRALEYELETCSGCSHKEKLKYLVDQEVWYDWEKYFGDMIRKE